jgi:uncharacterized membrane protein YuzA (DUF378 family)
MDALFTAFGVSTLATNVTTILTGGVGIMVIFTGYRFLKKASRSM